MIDGFDDDLAGEATRVVNRLHGLLTQIHPSLERVLGPRLQHPAVLTLLERFGSPAQIRKAGRCRLVTLLRPKAPRMAERLVEEIFAALDEQTVTVPGTEAATLFVPSLAASLTAVLDQRKLLARRIEELLPPSFQSPDVDAGHRRQDRSPHPDRGRRRQHLPHCRPPRRLRRSRPGDPTSPTTTRRSPRASTTPRPCSASPDAGRRSLRLRDGTLYEPQLSAAVT